MVTTPKIRHLRLDLLSLYHSRGEMLVRAMRKFGEWEVMQAAQRSGMSINEIRNSVRLYREWKEFIAAERWNHDRGGETPGTSQAALDLLERWCKRGAKLKKPSSDGPLARVIGFIFALAFALQFTCAHHSLREQLGYPGYSLLEEITIGCPFEALERVI